MKRETSLFFGTFNAQPQKSPDFYGRIETDFLTPPALDNEGFDLCRNDKPASYRPSNQK